MRVLIVGCGYVGSCIGAELSSKGHSVWGLRRSETGDCALRTAGILPIHADITVPESLQGLESAFDWVVHCVSASGRSALDYKKVYFEGTRNLVFWLHSAIPSKLVFTSSTSVYGQTDGSLVDEASPVIPATATAQVILQTEELLLEAAAKSGLPAVILRVAGIYGPGRTHWLDAIRRGSARIERGERNLNMVHRDDVTGAVVAALEHADPGRIYNVVDDQPVSQRVLLEWLSRRLKVPTPAETEQPTQSGKRGSTNKRISNRRLKAELRYSLRFPTFKEGYESILRG